MKMRKDLIEAFRMASENMSLDDYKRILQEAEQELQRAREEAQQLAAARKSKKNKATEEAEPEDVEMADTVEGDQDEDVPANEKKRKAEEPAEVGLWTLTITPQSMLINVSRLLSDPTRLRSRRSSSPLRPPPSRPTARHRHRRQQKTNPQSRPRSRRPRRPAAMRRKRRKRRQRRRPPDQRSRSCRPRRNASERR
jgi:hypothetical protein